MGESLVAEVAGEGPLAGVGERVALQLGGRREVLAALIALVHAPSLPVIWRIPSGLGLIALLFTYNVSI